jgi:hypothetical protein
MMAISFTKEITTNSPESIESLSQRDQGKVPSFKNLININKPNELGLHSAVLLGRIEVVKDLLKKGVNVNGVFTPTKTHKIPENLPQGCWANRTSYDILNRSDMRWTPLHLAAHLGNAEIIKLLIENGALVNQNLQSPDSFGTQKPTNSKPCVGITPLHLAVRVGNLEAVKTLLSHGANVNQQSQIPRVNHLGETQVAHWASFRPLDWAVNVLTCENRQSLPIIQCLIDHGAERYAKRYYNKAPNWFGYQYHISCQEVKEYIWKQDMKQYPSPYNDPTGVGYFASACCGGCKAKRGTPQTDLERQMGIDPITKKKYQDCPCTICSDRRDLQKKYIDELRQAKL